MRQKKIQSIRKTLVKKMDEIWSNAHSTLAKMKNSEGSCADPFDQAASESNKFVELACRDRERDLMLNIKETILRIDRGLFGMCDHCGRIIDDRRLCIEPMSRLCAQCQEEEERNFKRKNRQWAMKGMSYNHV
ncbi:MAG: RNA polymerase-binding protein DksA [Deltaproteobacteria bacterium]|nr:RNA polymerase-binding protein DksA [Deltaproteobacteria bacterium]